jgi:hypothetical protein
MFSPPLRSLPVRQWCFFSEREKGVRPGSIEEAARGADIAVRAGLPSPIVRRSQATGAYTAFITVQYSSSNAHTYHDILPWLLVWI